MKIAAASNICATLPATVTDQLTPVNSGKSVLRPRQTRGDHTREAANPIDSANNSLAPGTESC